jgi:hypothetical protein
MRLSSVVEICRMVAVCEGSAPDLRGHLTLLLGGAVSPASFWTWFVGVESAMESCASDDMFDLYQTVEAIFAEYTGGHIDRHRLLASIAKVVRERGPLEPGRTELARVPGGLA